MIRFTAIAAVMLSGTPELWPSPCPGAPAIIGARYATPGFCDACGMQSTSEPSAITGLPDPNRAVHARRNACHAFLDREAFLLEDAGQVSLRLELLESELAEAEHRIDHLLREVVHAVDVGDRLLSCTWSSFGTRFDGSSASPAPHS